VAEVRPALAAAAAVLIGALLAHPARGETLPPGGEAARAAALAREGRAHLEAGRHARAVAELEAALSAAQRVDDAALQVRIEAAYGDALRRIGDLHGATRALDRALARARREAPGSALEAAVLNDVGVLLESEPAPAPGRSAPWPSDAADAYRRAATLAREAGDGGIEAIALTNFARVASAPEVDTALALALERQLAAAIDGARTHGLLGVARVALDRGGDAALVHRALAGAEAGAKAAGDQRALAYALGYRGELYAREGRLEEALRLTTRAGFLADAAGAAESLYLWQWQRARIRRSLGERVAAVTDYEAAVATVRSLRTELAAAGAAGTYRFERSVVPLFLELVELYLEEASRLEGAPAQARLVDARAAMEWLKSAELEEYFQDECVAALQARARPVEAIGKRTAALYPIVLPDRIELLVTLPDGIARTTIRVDAREVTETARRFRELLERRTREYLRPARRLHEWLIASIAARLEAADVETLVVVPGGSLRAVPFAALHDGERHLVERYAIAVVPGLSLLDPRPLPRGDLQVLLAGLSEPVQGFPALPHVSGELDQVGEVLGGGTRIEGSDFVRPALQAAIERREYSVVHLASHAHVGSTPSESFLLTHDGRIDMDGLEALVGPSRFRDQPLELLTLSACETAAGDERAALGLAGIAVKAGARSAFASLWLVNDEATALLVSEFYRRLAEPDTSKAQALRAAQARLLGDIRYRLPVYWAPFLIIGNWL
jgi:CHAT domain-containing protein